MATNDPMEAAVRAGAVTPLRTSAILFDVPEQVLTERGVCYHRRAGQIHPRTAMNVTRLKSGVIALDPVQGLGFGHETTLAQGYVLRLSEFSAHSVVVEKPHQRIPTELTGIVAAGGVSTAGDYFFTKSVVAGTTWNNVLSSPTLPSFGTPNYPLDRLMTTVANMDAQTGFQVKIQTSADVFATTDVFAGVEFGGEIYGSGAFPHTGFGRFYLLLAGNGVCTLYERIDNAWAEVDRWQGFRPYEGQGAVICRIWPHYPNWIEFSTIPASGTFTLVDLLALITALTVGAEKQVNPFDQFVHIHSTANRADQAVAPGPGYLQPMTGTGRLSFDLRQDLRARWQLARLGFPSSGSLTTRGFTLPYGYEDAHIVRLNVKGYDHYVGSSPVTSLSGILQAHDGSSLGADTESIPWAGGTVVLSGWNPPGGENRMRAVLTLTNSQSAGSRFHTPVLTAYSVIRNGHIATHAPGIKTGGLCTGISITGPGYEPEHESASVAIDDIKNQLSFLRARAKASVRIESTYPTSGTESVATVVMFEGVTSRVNTNLTGIRGGVYPSADRHMLDIECNGRWERLADRFFHDLIPFDDSADSPSGRTGNRTETWKVTDVIRVCLGLCGVPPANMLIFDDPLRLFAPVGREAAGLLITQPGASILEYISGLAKEYLGAWLTWSPNAGSSGGMWILKRPPTGDETPVWNFVTTAPAGAGRLPLRAGAHAANTSQVWGPSDLFPLHGETVPPEGNVLTVVGGVNPSTGTRVQRTLTNPISWTSPTSSIASDTDLDYLGRITEVAYVDVTITDQPTADWLARRVFQIALRGRRYVSLTSECAFLPANALDPVTYPVKLRRLIEPGDTVTLDGTRYICHSCDPSWETDLVMGAFYNLELYRGNLIFR